jgi:hypothetical protein
LVRLIVARTSKTDLGSSLLYDFRDALRCLSPSLSGRRLCTRLASSRGLRAFELLGSGRAIRTDGLGHLSALALGIDAFRTSGINHLKPE